MALPTLSDLKDYLRIESSAENALLTALLGRAKAMLELWTDTPITATSQSAIDRADALDLPVTSLVFPRRPCAVTAIVDSDGMAVSAADYWVDGRSHDTQRRLGSYRLLCLDVDTGNPSREDVVEAVHNTIFFFFFFRK